MDTASDLTQSPVKAGYTGHEYDAELGLVNMKGRIYDPSIQRFLTPDPYVTDPFNPQGLNRFSYVQNNPLNFVDPSGFEQEGPDHIDMAAGGGGANSAKGGAPAPQPSQPKTSGTSTATNISTNAKGQTVISGFTMTTASGGGTTTATSGPGGNGNMEGRGGHGEGAVGGPGGDMQAGANQSPMSAPQGVNQSGQSWQSSNNGSPSGGPVSTKLGEGRAIFPGQPGNPAVGNPMNRNAVQQDFDEFARFFRVRSSPRDPDMNVMQATQKYSNEHWQVVVRDALGTMQAKSVQLGGDRKDKIKVSIPPLRPGESAVMIHSHFGDPKRTDRAQLSDVDLGFGRSGVPVYVVGPDWSIRVFESGSDSITEIPR